MLSALSLHSVKYIQVLRQLGSTDGAGTSTTGADEVGAGVEPTGTTSEMLEPSGASVVLSPTGTASEVVNSSGSSVVLSPTGTASEALKSSGTSVVLASTGTASGVLKSSGSSSASVVLAPTGTASEVIKSSGTSVVLETGQIVVETATIDVTTVVDSAGHSVTSGAQLVTVSSMVEKMVLVVISTDDGVVAGSETVSGLSTDEDSGDSGAAVASGLSTDEDSSDSSGAGVVDPTGTASEVLGPSGTSVVETAIVDVTTVVDSAGHSVTSGAQLVMVSSMVEKTVLAVISTDDGVSVAAGSEMVSGLSIDEDSGDSGASVVESTGTASEVFGASAELETGQMVVDTAIVDVTTVVDSAGHSVTSGAQLVMVSSVVEKMVLVVISTDDVATESVSGLSTEEEASSEGAVVSGMSSDEDGPDAGIGVPVTSDVSGLSTDDEGADAEPLVSGTDTTLVETAKVDVTSVVESAGQSGTSDAQLVMVRTDVAKTVDVDGCCVVVAGTGVPTDSASELDSAGLVAGTELPSTGTDSVTKAGDVAESLSAVVVSAFFAGGLQSKLIFWMPTSQSPFSFSAAGSLKVTFLAPPHWSFFTVAPPGPHAALERHLDPSGMWYVSWTSTSRSDLMYMSRIDMPFWLSFVSIFGMSSSSSCSPGSALSPPLCTFLSCSGETLATMHLSPICTDCQPRRRSFMQISSSSLPRASTASRRLLCTQT